jgi:hypothetical protein
MNGSFVPKSRPLPTYPSDIDLISLLFVDIYWLNAFLYPPLSIRSMDGIKQSYSNPQLPDVFDYIEVFYNRQRRHSHLGGVSPEAFEQASF